MVQMTLQPVSLAFNSRTATMAESAPAEIMAHASSSYTSDAQHVPWHPDSTSSTSTAHLHHIITQQGQQSHQPLAADGVTGNAPNPLSISYQQLHQPYEASELDAGPSFAVIDPPLSLNGYFYGLTADLHAGLDWNNASPLHHDGREPLGTDAVCESTETFCEILSQLNQHPAAGESASQLPSGLIYSDGLIPLRSTSATLAPVALGPTSELHPSRHTDSYAPSQFSFGRQRRTSTSSNALDTQTDPNARSGTTSVSAVQDIGIGSRSSVPSYETFMGGGAQYPCPQLTNFTSNFNSTLSAQPHIPDQSSTPAQPRSTQGTALRSNTLQGVVSQTGPSSSSGPISAAGESSYDHISGVQSIQSIQALLSVEESEGASQEKPLELPRPRSQQPMKKRGPFDSQKRKETAETRKRRACLRCRIQKIRCDADSTEAEGSCLPCKCFSKISKKTIHHVSCFRRKLTEIVLFRKGGLRLTDRWQGTEMKDVGDRVDTEVRTIQITLGICSEPLEIKVVRFRAGAGDVVARFWTVKEGERGDEVRKKKDLEPYCLVDVWATATHFEKYIIDNAVPTMIRVNTPHELLQKTFLGQDVIHKTYIMAVQHYLSMDDHIQGPSGKIANPQKTLLGSLFVLWLAVRHTTGSAYICGEDTLGMKPETKDETYPLFGKVSMPRIIVAQFDSINHTKLLSKYGHRVLRSLESFIFRNQSTFWWTIYLCVFILLHEASWLSADRYRHARHNFGGRYRYSIPSFVEELQEGCNNILVHWHYYNCHPWPKADAPWERHKHFMSELSSEQHDLVMETMTDTRIQKQLSVWKRYREENGFVARSSLPVCHKQETPYMGSQTQFDWDHPCYWIAQMFEERWQPHPTYQREHVY